MDYTNVIAASVTSKPQTLVEIFREPNAAKKARELIDELDRAEGNLETIRGILVRWRFKSAALATYVNELKEAVDSNDGDRYQDILNILVNKLRDGGFNEPGKKPTMVLDYLHLVDDNVKTLWKAWRARELKEVEVACEAIVSYLEPVYEWAKSRQQPAISEPGVNA